MRTTTVEPAIRTVRLTITKATMAPDGGRVFEGVA